MGIPVGLLFPDRYITIAYFINGRIHRCENWILCRRGVIMRHGNCDAANPITFEEADRCATFLAIRDTADIEMFLKLSTCRGTREIPPKWRQISVREAFIDDLVNTLLLEDDDCEWEAHTHTYIYDSRNFWSAVPWELDRKRVYLYLGLY